MAYLELNNIYKTYGEGENATEVLSDINLSIEEGEFVAIVGFTGSGKTTLVNLINGLLKPTSGEVLFKGEPVVDTSHERGVIFQNYSLLPWLTVGQNVYMAVKEAYPKENKTFLKQRVNDYVAMVSLSPAINKRPKELSGGMQRRIALARTLILKPKIILYDEPTTGLDPITSKEIIELMRNIQIKYGTSSLIITHDVDCARVISDRMILLVDGINYAEGKYRDLIQSNDPKIEAFFKK